MQTAADDFFSKGLARSTVKTYSSGVRKYTAYCVSGESPSPHYGGGGSGFVASLAKEKLSYASIRTYLSLIRYRQIVCGHGDPAISQMSRLEYVLKGIQKEEAHSQIVR